jgi:type 1 glutamine amidotransferase
MKKIAWLWAVFASVNLCAQTTPTLYINQVTFDSQGPKMAVIGAGALLPEQTPFFLVNAASGRIAFSGFLGNPRPIDEWAPDRQFYPADFSGFTQPGSYRIRITVDDAPFTSEKFEIGGSDWARPLVSAILHYYNKQRANTPAELSADRHLILFGSDGAGDRPGNDRTAGSYDQPGGHQDRTVDLHGGWCDASGDVSKYFSHLAYANYMSPQQIPLVTWSLINTGEALRTPLARWGLTDSLTAEALWGADYLMRALSKEDYFYMIVFSYFNKDPNARRVVGLHANSVTTAEYQCAFREGGGMAIAALARISQWKKTGDFTPRQYLDAARRAYAHLAVNNKLYDDDGKENIIDDYCALMAATELWIATDSSWYRDQARQRADNLSNRMTTGGYFRADDASRPFWHASDAGLPVVALTRYLDKEKDPAHRGKALDIIRKALDYNLRVTGEVDNPFGYARQTFLYKDSVKDGFFIPHDNETGWWWQGENARLASLATAALVGGRLLYTRTASASSGTGSREPSYAASRIATNWGVSDSLAYFAARQISWILGCNPYSMCFMYQFGTNNVPYMHSNFGHGSERGGISNGITGKEGHGDGSGIDFRTTAEGNEWRWTEQWIPHAAWFLQAITAMSAHSDPPAARPTVPPGLQPRFHVLALYENGGHHIEYSRRAITWLDQLAADSNFTIDYIRNTEKIDAGYLKKYQLFIQLDFPPYAWKSKAVDAFRQYIEEGRGGWIGFHHATLLGEFDGYPMWRWFSQFMGGITYKNYIATFVQGEVKVEDRQHPVLKGVPDSFLIKKEEWYTYDKSPRPNVHVLARVDESSYSPGTDIKMGDHPVIWTNEQVRARNVYIFMGHSPALFDNTTYKQIFTNSIFWAASTTP